MTSAKKHSNPKQELKSFFSKLTEPDWFVKRGLKNYRNTKTIQVGISPKQEIYFSFLTLFTERKPCVKILGEYYTLKNGKIVEITDKKEIPILDLKS